MTDSRQKPTIFISYTDSDRKWASEFADHLKDEADPRLPDHPVDASAQAEAQLRKDLRASEYFVLILPDQRTKLEPWLGFEWGAAIGTEKRAFVVSPRGSHLDMGQIPTYARTLSYFKKMEAEETAEAVLADLKACAEARTAPA